MRSFLGMAQHGAKFIDNFSTITEPLRALTKQDSEWDWTKEQEDAFERFKATLSENTTLAYFDPKKHRNPCRCQSSRNSRNVESEWPSGSLCQSITH